MRLFYFHTDISAPALRSSHVAHLIKKKNGYIMDFSIAAGKFIFHSFYTVIGI